MKTLLTLLLIAASAIVGAASVIEGRIQNGHEGEATTLHRIRVELLQNDEVVAVVRPNPFGYYRFYDLTAGMYTVEAVTSRHVTFEPQSVEVDLAKGGTATINFLYYPYNPCFAFVPC